MNVKPFFAAFCCLFIYSIGSAQVYQGWGTTTQGGLYSQGALYRVNSDGTDFTVMFNFKSPDGFMPIGDVMKASDGNIYGTCYEGGDYYSCTIYSFNPQDSTCVDVYDFDIVNGDFPQSGLVEGPGGILYGVATTGGTYGKGVIYSFNLSTQVYSPLYSFNTPTGSQIAAKPLLLDEHLLYGVASYGGTNNEGTIYEYDLNTGSLRVLHSMDYSEGAWPRCELLLASDGKLYGVAPSGGSATVGTIFRVDRVSGNYEMLAEFTGAEGEMPTGGLAEGPDGMIYGTTTLGGANGAGGIFRYDRFADTLAAVFHFQSGTHGNDSQAKLMVGPDGKLYGSNQFGGMTGNGTLFKFDPVALSCQVIQHFNYCKQPEGTLFFPDAPAQVRPPVQLKLSAEVIPNPTTGFFNLSCTGLGSGNASITLVNATGQVVKSDVVELQNGKSRHVVNADELPAGLYFATVQLGNKKATAKVVVQ